MLRTNHNHSITHHLEINHQAVFEVSLRFTSKHVLLRGQSVTMCAIVCTSAPQWNRASCALVYTCAGSSVFWQPLLATFWGEFKDCWEVFFRSRKASLLLSLTYSIHRCRWRDAGVAHSRLVIVAKLLQNGKHCGTFWCLNRECWLSLVCLSLCLCYCDRFVMEWFWTSCT